MGLALESNGFKDSEQDQMRKLNEFLWDGGGLLQNNWIVG